MRTLDSLLGRVRRIPPIVIDAAIAAAIVMVESVELLSPSETKRLPQLGLLLLGALGVTLRRKKLSIAFLLVVLAATIGLLVKVPFVLSGGGELDLYLVLYTIADRRGTAMAILALLPVLTLDALGWHQARSDLDHPVSESLFLEVVFNDFLWIGFAWFAGLAQNRRRRIAAELERSAAELRAERDRLAEAAVTAERTRIARDLHALVVRGIEEMNLHTRAAQLRLDVDRTEAIEAIATMESRGRETLVQMRRLVSVLRAHSDGVQEASGPFDRKVRTTTSAAVRSVNATRGSLP
jgi:signal transduction histidine kinase